MAVITLRSAPPLSRPPSIPTCFPSLCEACIGPDGTDVVYHLGQPTRWTAGGVEFELSPHRIDVIGPWGCERTRLRLPAW